MGLDHEANIGRNDQAVAPFEAKPGQIFVTKALKRDPEISQLTAVFENGRAFLENLLDGRSFSTTLNRIRKGWVGGGKILGVLDAVEQQPVASNTSSAVEDPNDKPTVLIYSKSGPKEDPLPTVMGDEQDGLINLVSKSERPEDSRSVIAVEPQALLRGEDRSNRYEIEYNFDVKPGEEVFTGTTLLGQSDEEEAPSLFVGSQSQALSPETLERARQLFDELKIQVESKVSEPHVKKAQRRSTKRRGESQEAPPEASANSPRLSLDEIEVGQYIDGIRSDGVKVTFFVSAINELTQRPFLETLSPDRPKRYELSVGKDGTPRAGRYRLLTPVSVITQVVEMIGRGFMPAKKLRPQFGNNLVFKSLKI